MAERKKDRERSTDPAPFNNPFSEGLRGLRRALRERQVARVTAPPPASPAARSSDVSAPRPKSDAEEFLGAVEDAVPLTASARRVRPRESVSPPCASRTHSRAQHAIDFVADEHFDGRFSDRYIRACAAGVSNETLAKLERGEFAVRSHVDLHGMALDDAKYAVDQFLTEQQRRGERCVLVITGKGRNSRQQVGVLREKIPQWLARGPSARRVLAFVTARPCDGGEGALYVLLRRERAPKSRIDVIAGGGVT